MDKYFYISRNLDDELHSLLNCEFHTYARKAFYSVLYESIANFESLSDDDKFRAVLTTPNEDVTYLGKLIHDGFKSRDPFQRNIFDIFNTGFTASV